MRLYSFYGFEARRRVLVRKLPTIETITINVKDTNRHTSLSWAAGNGHIAVVEFLLGAGAMTESSDALSWAAGNGHTRVVELLLGKGAM